jgi:hypothetical protein
MREAGILAGAYFGGAVILWLLAGQSLFHLPSYLRNGWDAINGYDDAVGTDAPSLNYKYWWALASVLAVAMAVFWRDRDLPGLRRSAIGLLWFWFAYTAFRHALSDCPLSTHSISSPPWLCSPEQF